MPKEYEQIKHSLGGITRFQINTFFIYTPNFTSQGKFRDIMLQKKIQLHYIFMMQN